MHITPFFGYNLRLCCGGRRGRENDNDNNGDDNTTQQRGDVMPKMKTNKGAAKRFGRTGTGKIKRARAYCRHCLSHKSPDQKRRLRRDAAHVVGKDARRIARLLPYS